jgi:hypothetical protein
MCQKLAGVPKILVPRVAARGRTERRKKLMIPTAKEKTDDSNSEGKNL